MKLKEILTFLKGITEGFQNYYIGKLDSKKDNSLGVYNLRRGEERQIAIGGENETKTKSKALSLLIHGNNNKTQTEALADALYQVLSNTQTGNIGNRKIQYIRLLCPEPIDVDFDDKGIYEYVIELEIYYE